MPIHVQRDNRVGYLLGVPATRHQHYLGRSILHKSDPKGRKDLHLLLRRRQDIQSMGDGIWLPVLLLPMLSDVL